MSASEIGRRIFEARIKSGLTQDLFGRKYNVSGPAVFKFEKSKVRPSLDVWLMMAKDAGLTERHAVLLWARERLPEKHRDYLDIPLLLKEDEAEYGKKGKSSYATIKDPAKLRKTVKADTTLPHALREMLDDSDLWSLFKPTGQEIQTLKVMFASMGLGTKDLYREGLRLIRGFYKS